MVNRMYRYVILSFIFLVVSVVFLQAYNYKNEQMTIKIGVKNLTEQQIVAYAIEDVVEAKTDYKVDVITGMDATSILNYALLRQDIDLYIEYSSVALIEIYHHMYEGQSNAQIIKTIKKDYQKDGLSWLVDLGFENSNAVICKEYCEKNNISKLSDIKAKQNFSFSSPLYFYERSDGFKLLEKTYGYQNVDKINLDLPLIFPAISNGESDLGLAFTTDAKLASEKYKVLDDDLNAFASYQAGIIVNDKSLKKFPDLEEILKQFEHKFTTKDIQAYNDMVENGDKSPQEIGKIISAELMNS